MIETYFFANVVRDTRQFLYSFEVSETNNHYCKISYKGRLNTTASSLLGYFDKVDYILVCDFIKRSNLHLTSMCYIYSEIFEHFKRQ
jgi:hypothetical protein